MFKKRYGLILIACLIIGFPIHSVAADKASTQVGIGFAEETANSQEKPTKDSDTKDSKAAGAQQGNNASGTTTRYGSTSHNGKSFLPSTGEKQVHWYQIIGFGCVTAVFGLGLYVRFNKEGNHE